MTSNCFTYYYKDGNEICLGDYVIENGHYGYIERIWEPNSPGAVRHEIPRGGFTISFVDSKIPTIMEFDSLFVLCPEHSSLELIHRATRHYHVRYSWMWFREFRSAHSSWHRKRRRLEDVQLQLYVYHCFLEYILSLGELLQATAFGPGNSVRQLCEQFDIV